MNDQTESMITAVGRTDIYFSQAIENTARQQGLNASDYAKAYVAGMMADFSHKERLFTPATDTTQQERDDASIDSLTQLILEARATRGGARDKLKRAGDLALFLTGFFHEWYNRKNAPSRKYHQDLGAMAYHRLSRISKGAVAEPLVLLSVKDVYEELSDSFTRFAEVLCEISDRSHLLDDRGILRLYDRWLNSGNAYQARILREKGLTAIDGPKN
jgi:hypothetical protein